MPDPNSLPTYPTLRTEAEALAPAGEPGLRVERMGYSEDYPERSANPRPITAVIMGDPDGKTAYIEGVQHGNERVGAATARVLRLLGIKYPFFRRMGYDALVVSDHNDPDAMQLQDGDDGPITLENLAGKYRGYILDQHSWGFPTPTMRYIGGSIAATLRVIREHDLAFFGALHGALMQSEINTSRVAADEVKCYSHLLGSLGMKMPSSEHMAAREMFGPGVSRAFTKETVHTSHLAESASGEPLDLDGTTVCDHLEAKVKYFNPDIACFCASPDEGDPLTNQTFLEVAHERITSGIAIIKGMPAYLEDPRLKDWLTANSHIPEVARLHRAASWWGTTLPDIFAGEIRSIQEHCQQNDQKLRQSEVAVAYPYALANTAIYLGNIASLAGRAQLPDMQRAILLEAKGATDRLPNLRPIPVAQQVAAQSLAVLAAMNYARH